MVVNDVHPELISLSSEIRPDPQDELAEAVGVSYLSTRLQVDVGFTLGLSLLAHLNGA